MLQEIVRTQCSKGDCRNSIRGVLRTGNFSTADCQRQGFSTTLPLCCKPIQAFADAQGVKTTGTTGYAYFSKSRDKHIRISDDSTEVYLHPYKWGKNGYFGDGEAMPDQTFTPAK